MVPQLINQALIVSLVVYSYHHQDYIYVRNCYLERAGNRRTEYHSSTNYPRLTNKQTNNRTKSTNNTNKGKGMSMHIYGERDRKDNNMYIHLLSLSIHA